MLLISRSFTLRIASSALAIAIFSPALNLVHRGALAPDRLEQRPHLRPALEHRREPLDSPQRLVCLAERLHGGVRDHHPQRVLHLLPGLPNPLGVPPGRQQAAEEGPLPHLLDQLHGLVERLLERLELRLALLQPRPGRPQHPERARAQRDQALAQRPRPLLRCHLLHDERHEPRHGGHERHRAQDVQRPLRDAEELAHGRADALQPDLAPERLEDVPSRVQEHRVLLGSLPDRGGPVHALLDRLGRVPRGPDRLHGLGPHEGLCPPPLCPLLRCHLLHHERHEPRHGGHERHCA